jgi:23S rRNA pseudouridine2605 synthase
MEELIQAGAVSVNGVRARLGLRVSAMDQIVVNGSPITNRARRLRQRLPSIVLYHKPEGEIVTRHDPEGRRSVFDRAAFLGRGRWLAIGRLDFNTCGLLIFTDSGELANLLSHPRSQMRRDYAIRVVGVLSPEQVRRLKSGVELDDGMARFEMLEAQGGEGSNRWYRIRVREGRNRLVRRMFQSLGVTISRLMRVGFGPFDLPPRVKRGQWLRLDEDTVRRALSALPGSIESSTPGQVEGAASTSKPRRRVRASPRAGGEKPPRPRQRLRSR